MQEITPVEPPPSGVQFPNRAEVLPRRRFFTTRPVLPWLLDPETNLNFWEKLTIVYKNDADYLKVISEVMGKGISVDSPMELLNTLVKLHYETERAEKEKNPIMVIDKGTTVGENAAMDALFSGKKISVG